MSERVIYCIWRLMLWPLEKLIDYAIWKWEKVHGQEYWPSN